MPAFLTVDDVYVGESAGFAEFVVRLDAPATSAVTVRWATDNYTAGNNGDYGYKYGDLTFAAGETAKVVRVAITNDTVAEAVEAFEFELYSPSANATLARPGPARGAGDDRRQRRAAVQSAVVDGTSNSDVLFGSKGIDRINASGGADYIFSSFGKDVFDGGSGIDTVDYSEKLVSISVALNRATDVSVKVGARPRTRYATSRTSSAG